jgi:membrane-bound lytic murein transglycosylase B
VIALPEPDLGQLYWMATPNFFAITHYNRSYFYAVSVLALSEALSTKGA